MGPQPVLVDDRFEIGPELRLPAVVLAPVLGRLEGEAVLVAAHVDARTGVAVLPPGAARAGVLVDDRERKPGLGESDAGEDPAHPAADDHDRGRGSLLLGDLVPPGDRLGVATLELQVVEEEAGQTPLDGAAAEEFHHLPQ